MAKDKTIVIDSGDALARALNVLEYIEALAVQKQDTETLFNVAAMWVDVFGRLTETGEIITGKKPSHLKSVGFTVPEPPKAPGKDE